MTETRTRGDRRVSKIAKHLRDAGGEVQSICVGFKYARNGNLHNPTPELVWTASLRGRLVTAGASSRRAAIEVLSEAMKETPS